MWYIYHLYCIMRIENNAQFILLQIRPQFGRILEKIEAIIIGDPELNYQTGNACTSKLL